MEIAQSESVLVSHNLRVCSIQGSEYLGTNKNYTVVQPVIQLQDLLDPAYILLGFYGAQLKCSW
jgi:hypothetical protein